ncbi:hypothetical protein RUM43_004290 [Polyplax serrata]|uniref:Tetratricopeptide repeat protein 37 n=1 Tax=Polyplax serrata TaxID=468196 RepID=A0AAN8XKY5_POLSC
MNAKEIKAALKSAKENLDQKDFKAAIKQCKNVLKVDRNNYLALVLYGAAVQETEQRDEAPKAFKKAIEVSPELILAWRGLVCYYEKTEGNENVTDLKRGYEKLVLLETDFLKFSEAIEKLQKLILLEYDASNVRAMRDLLPTVDNERKLILHQYLVMVLESHITDEFKEQYENSLQYLLSIGKDLNNYLEVVKKYLKYLYKKQNLLEIINIAGEEAKHYSNDVALLEWICKAYTELPEVELQHSVPDAMLKESYTKLLQLVVDSYLGYFCKGLHEVHVGDLINATETLKNATKLKPNLGNLWLKLGQCQIDLYQFAAAEESCTRALKLFECSEKSKDLLFVCELKLLNALCEQEEDEKLTEAEKLGRKLLQEQPDNTSVLEFLTKTLIKKEQYAEVQEYINKLSQSAKHMHVAKYLECFILKQKNETVELKSKLEKLIVETPEYFLPWLELGLIYYNEGSSSCLTYLLKSTKLNQWCYLNFFYLGQCYSSMVKDLEKARRCYQKAFQLNPSSAEVGRHLSDMYRILGKEELNLQLLTTLTLVNSRSKWAWLKLGLHYLSTNQHHEAVKTLQTAVRLDPEDKTAWECLGDAYFAQGAHTSAIKSYEKASELNADSIYSVLQIAKIKHLIGLFHESVEEFRVINSRITNYIPALKGHSEACLSLMRHYLSQNLNGLAKDVCQESVFYSVKCLEQQKDLICVWKLLGDCCILLSGLPDKYCFLKIPTWLHKGKSSDAEEVTLDKVQILKLASRCYCQAIVINSRFANLWYDLAFAYNSLVRVSTGEESRKQMRNLACSAVKKSIQLDDSSWENWNLFGLILASKEIQNYKLAQHCFIKAIEILDTNAVTWTNLGTLYLSLNDLQISNQSFTEAQKFDHDYVPCWVGQAIIAQRTGHHDAMDLFRHSTQLGFTSEGYLGYSNLVCHTILNVKDKNDKNYLYSIENMNGITVAVDLLTWYTDRFTDNFWAFNMLGLLLERKMLYRSSVEAFRRALEIVESGKGPANEGDREELTDKILLNFSRVLSQLNRFDEALTLLKQIKKANFTNQCELAVTYFKAKLYEEAYSSYETTLEWLAPDTEMKSHILVAMAAVVYLHQGQEDAKILLMQACQLKPTSVQGLFACCALGMLHSDLALSELALKELDVYKNDARYLTHIALFQAYIYLFKGQKDKAIHAFYDVIHRHPSQSSLWLNLSLLLLNLHTTFRSKSAARCAEIALIMGRSSIDVSKVMSLVCLSNLLSGEGLKSLKSSQKAVHMFPDVTENWVSLLASVMSKCLQQESSKEVFWLKRMIVYIRSKFESSKPMTQWLSDNNKTIEAWGEKLKV